MARYENITIAYDEYGNEVHVSKAVPGKKYTCECGATVIRSTSSLGKPFYRTCGSFHVGRRCELISMVTVSARARTICEQTDFERRIESMMTASSSAHAAVANEEDDDEGSFDDFLTAPRTAALTLKTIVEGQIWCLPPDTPVMGGVLGDYVIGREPMYSKAVRDPEFKGKKIIAVGVEKIAAIAYSAMRHGLAKGNCKVTLKLYTRLRRDGETEYQYKQLILDFGSNADTFEQFMAVFYEEKEQNSWQYPKVEMALVAGDWELVSCQECPWYRTGEQGQSKRCAGCQGAIRTPMIRDKQFIGLFKEEEIVDGESESVEESQPEAKEKGEFDEF